MTIESQPDLQGDLADAAELRSLRKSMDACRADIERRVSDARSMSEQEVVAIGACIKTIVDDAKAYVADIQQQRLSRARSEQESATMVRDMIGAVHRQEATVEKAMTQSSAILKAGRDVQAMASATRLLSLNARVEASRLGDQGSSFSVIADEMRQLSHAVQTTNNSVANMAKQLERLLPEISEQARVIQSQFEQFIQHVERQMQDAGIDDGEGAEGNPVIEKIMASAYEALSHLAFQDPMAQSLGRIMASIDRLRSDMDRLSAPGDAPIDDDVDAEPMSAEESADIEAGEIMLF